jgi:ABC-type Fe3+/spermidine/putrescine transport system ATPase subunit
VSYLEIEDLRVRYGEQTVLDGVSIAVEPGERLCLLGPSGCGKTTTLQVVAGFVVPDAGRVRIGGRNVVGDPPEQRNIGVMFQSYALFPHLSVQDNVGFGLRMRRRPAEEIRRRVGEALDFVRLNHAGSKQTRMLSGGEQQRVAFARAIVIEPRLLLLDEPFSNLDARLRQEMRSELLGLLQKLKIATIMVTHDQEEAMAIADRVAVMRAGRIEQVGSPAEIYAKPSSLFVARFVGESIVLAGRVAALGGESGDAVDVPGIGRLVGYATASLAPGEQVQVLLRPQHLQLRPVDGAPAPLPGWNRLSAEIEQVLFLGHRTECYLRLGEHRIIVWQNAPLAPSLRSGAPALIEWQARDTLLLRAER